MLGMMDSGKSTIVGVLSSGELDNGRGKARLNLFRHPHEIQSGRTSSISREMIGFTTGGQVCFSVRFCQSCGVLVDDRSTSHLSGSKCAMVS